MLFMLLNLSISFLAQTSINTQACMTGRTKAHKPSFKQLLKNSFYYKCLFLSLVIHSSLFAVILCKISLRQSCLISSVSTSTNFTSEQSFNASFIEKTLNLPPPIFYNHNKFKLHQQKLKQRRRLQKPKQQQKRISALCEDSSISIPLSLLTLVYLVYLVEGWHSRMRVALRKKLSVKSFSKQIHTASKAPPIVVWKCLAYHYDRKCDYVIGEQMRNNGRYGNVYHFYQRINTHSINRLYDYWSSSPTCISEQDAPTRHYEIGNLREKRSAMLKNCIDLSDKDDLEECGVCKVEVVKGIQVVEGQTLMEFERQKKAFVEEASWLDELVDFEENLYFEGVDFFGASLKKHDQDTACVFVSNRWFVSSWCYWLATVLLLSWPYRIFIECITYRLQLNIRKLIGYDISNNFNSYQKYFSDDTYGEYNRNSENFSVQKTNSLFNGSIPHNLQTLQDTLEKQVTPNKKFNLLQKNKTLKKEETKPNLLFQLQEKSVIQKQTRKSPCHVTSDLKRNEKISCKDRNESLINDHSENNKTNNKNIKTIENKGNESNERIENVRRSKNDTSDVLDEKIPANSDLHDIIFNCDWHMDPKDTKMEHVELMDRDKANENCQTDNVSTRFNEINQTDSLKHAYKRQNKALNVKKATFVRPLSTQLNQHLLFTRQPALFRNSFDLFQRENESINAKKLTKTKNLEIKSSKKDQKMKGKFNRWKIDVKKRKKKRNEINTEKINHLGSETNDAEKVKNFFLRNKNKLEFNTANNNLIKSKEASYKSNEAAANDARGLKFDSLPISLTTSKNIKMLTKPILVEFSNNETTTLLCKTPKKKMKPEGSMSCQYGSYKSVCYLSPKKNYPDPNENNRSNHIIANKDTLCLKDDNSLNEIGLLNLKIENKKKGNSNNDGNFYNNKDINNRLNDSLKNNGELFKEKVNSFKNMESKPLKAIKQKKLFPSRLIVKRFNSIISCKNAFFKKSIIKKNVKEDDLYSMVGPKKQKKTFKKYASTPLQSKLPIKIPSNFYQRNLFSNKNEHSFSQMKDDNYKKDALSYEEDECTETPKKINYFSKSKKPSKESQCDSSSLLTTITMLDCVPSPETISLADA